MPTIPNLSKLTLIETEPTGVQFTDLPPELGVVILKSLMKSYDGPMEVCMGLRVMMYKPLLWARGQIGKLLGEDAKDPLVQEQLWRLAFLKYFGLPEPQKKKKKKDEDDPMADEDDPMADEDVFANQTEQDVFANQTEKKWAELFDRMCSEMKLFEKAKNPATSIELDWKDNASWTKHETDSMVLWLQMMRPREDQYAAARFNSGVNLHERYFHSPTMQRVLKLRGASVNRFNRRSSNNYKINDLLVRVKDFQGFLAIAEEVPMMDVDLSLPLIVGTNEQTIPQPYHRIIAELTDTMLYQEIVSAEAIKKTLYPSVMQTLVQKMGANPDVPSERHSRMWSPLCTAIKDGDNVAVVNLLMELGASTEPDFPLEPTPLMLACSSRYGESRLECARALLGWGADVNASRERGDTPLSLACEHCDSVELVDMLLEKNADPMPQMRSPEYRKHPLTRAKESTGRPRNTALIITLLEGAEAETTERGFEPTSDSDRQELHDSRMAEARAAGSGLEVFLF